MTRFADFPVHCTQYLRQLMLQTRVFTPRFTIWNILFYNYVIGFDIIFLFLLSKPRVNCQSPAGLPFSDSSDVTLSVNNLANMKQNKIFLISFSQIFMNIKNLEIKRLYRFVSSRPDHALRTTIFIPKRPKSDIIYFFNLLTPQRNRSVPICVVVHFEPDGV